MAITRFAGEYAFLSNFYPAPVRVHGMNFPTVEHAFQAAKVTLLMPETLRREAQLAISELATPALAKQWGRKVPIRPDWLEVRLLVMELCLHRKFKHEPLKVRLGATRPHELIEGNHWGDTFWGVCRGRGENHLGRLLMRIRGEGADL